VTWNEINLDSLNAFRSKAVITPESLKKAGMLRNLRNPVVLLGRGEVSKSLKVRVHRVSQSARTKIEAAGGTVEIIER
jgi:large subunit ribosomal protein L15